MYTSPLLLFGYRGFVVSLSCLCRGHYLLKCYYKLMSKNLVSKIRKEKRLTQEQLAEKCGLSTRTIQRLEVGEDTSMETLNIVSNVFGLTVSELFENIGDNEMEQNIINMTNEQIQQLRSRELTQSLFKRLTLFSFITIMLVLGSFIAKFSGNLEVGLAFVWFFSWFLGFSLIKIIRIKWLCPYWDRKYPLTKGVDVKH
ncbi:hypothetical protein FC60_GL001206 [Limosilactobacillus gastricus DSM 16045]|uniref:HTH cro/C1-type domain-containing protein n=2 Tax=Limosilactobacillus gastricus TaxID=227942 RepID=A0A0R1V4C2_9LACO|nr:hypothetical protein FC60_GL001206 [Limosilactobacillus gastricus DSM 16045]